MGRSREKDLRRQPVSSMDNPAREVILEEKLLHRGKRLRLCMIEEVVSFNAAAFANLTQVLPANSEVLDVQMNFETAMALNVAVKLGVGTAADPDAYLLSAVAMTRNAKNASRPKAVNAAALTPRISACDNAGAAAGTVTSGQVRVRIVYEYAEALPDAA